MPMRHIIATLLLLLTVAAAAQNAPSAEDVLAENSYAKITRKDYETELLRVPADLRDAFGTDPRRVTGLLDNLLLMKSLSALARQAGVDKDPDVQRRIAMETERLLAQLELQQIESRAGTEFDAKVVQFTERARELYQVDRKKYETPPQVLVSHILFDTKKRGDDAALSAAKDARAKILAGAKFEELAASLSDDPGTKVRGGRLDWFGEGVMDPAFTKAAFALHKPGEVSEPVKSAFGYHLIRLEETRPAREMTFDEVKPRILGELRTQYMTNARDEKIQAIRREPAKLNEPAINSLIKMSPGQPRSGAAATTPPRETK